MKKIGQKIGLFCVCIMCFSIFIFSGCEFYSINTDEKDYNSTLIEQKDYSSKEDLLASVSPAVVGILATTNSYQSIGSGVCVSEKGYILTNNHVVDGANSIKLFLHNNTTTSASLIWRDSSLDLAVLKCSISIPYLEMAENGTYFAGEDVVAIGTPLSLAFKHSATKGIISALNRTIQVDNDFGESTLSNLIQHDASINPGNSGGPLLDMKGRVLGINTVKVSDAEGMGFAIPISIGNAVIKKLSANGTYNTSYLGVMGYDANLKEIGKNKKGVFVVSVAENSPAEKMGLQKGDVITKVNNTTINNNLDLRLLIYSQNEDKVEIEIERNGEKLNLKENLIQHPYCYKCEKLNFEDFN